MKNYLNQPNKNGYNVLHKFCKYADDKNRESIELLYMMLDNGSDIHHVDKNGYTPYIIALKNKNYRIAKILLKEMLHDFKEENKKTYKRKFKSRKRGKNRKTQKKDSSSDSENE